MKDTLENQVLTPIIELNRPPATTHISAIPLRRSVVAATDCFRTRKRSATPVPSLRNHALAMINGQDVGSQPRPALDETLGNDTTSLETRQGACGTWYGTTRPVDNPDPHQNFYLKQLSVSLSKTSYSVVSCILSNPAPAQVKEIVR